MGDYSPVNAMHVMLYTSVVFASMTVTPRKLSTSAPLLSRLRKFSGLISFVCFQNNATGCSHIATR
ncbi:MAG: hypothetical protein WBW33_31160, partial [Bryobacteraceae bacterium]